MSSMTKVDLSGGRRAARWVFAAGLLALTGGVLAVGCGGGGIDLSTEEAFCQVVAQADGTQPVVSACYLANQSTIGHDTEACVALRSGAEQCNPQNLPYHADFAQPCVDAHSALYQSASLDPNALAAMNQACLAVFNRGGRVGSSCAADVDCDVGNGLSCVIHASGHGSCQVPVPVNPGDACTSPAAQCADGYFCEASGHCVSNPTAGGACGPGISCGTGLRCVASANGTAGVCQAQLHDQSPCTADSDCAGGFCVPTTSGSVCAGALPPLSFGAPSCTPFVAR